MSDDSNPMDTGAFLLFFSSFQPVKSCSGKKKKSLGL